MESQKENSSRLYGILASLILLAATIIIQWGWSIFPDTLFNLIVVFFTASVICYGFCLPSADAKDIEEFPTTL